MNRNMAPLSQMTEITNVVVRTGCGGFSERCVLDHLAVSVAIAVRPPPGKSSFTTGLPSPAVVYAGLMQTALVQARPVDWIRANSRNFNGDYVQFPSGLSNILAEQSTVNSEGRAG